MTTFLSRELREGLAAAHKLAQKRKSRLRIDVDGKTYPVLRVWDGGFAMDLEDAPICADWSTYTMAGGTCRIA